MKAESQKGYSVLRRFCVKSAGFTLIECLVVVAIIGVLAVLLMPTVDRVGKNAKLAASLSNIRQTGQAVLLYSAENNNCLPWAYGYNTEGAPNWIVALREAGYSNIIGASTPGPKNVMCSLALACRPANKTSIGSMFAMNYFASNRRLASIESPGQTALLMNGRWNPSARNWNQTEVGAGNGLPNRLPDFPYPIRALSASDSPQAKAENPSTVVFFIDGHSSLVSKSEFPDPVINTNTYKSFWGRN